MNASTTPEEQTTECSTVGRRNQSRRVRAWKHPPRGDNRRRPATRAEKQNGSTQLPTTQANPTQSQRCRRGCPWNSPGPTTSLTPIRAAQVQEGPPNFLGGRYEDHDELEPVMLQRPPPTTSSCTSPCMGVDRPSPMKRAWIRWGSPAIAHTKSKMSRPSPVRTPKCQNRVNAFHRPSPVGHFPISVISASSFTRSKLAESRAHFDLCSRAPFKTD